MVDMNLIRQAAQITTDKDGNPVVQIPLSVWQEAIEEEPQRELSQVEQIIAYMEEWKNDPDYPSQEWWAEFEQFLGENRVTFRERDLDFGDE